MGKLSDGRRAAQRPGSRERARVKKHHRGAISGYVPGAGIVTVYFGRKKATRVFHWFLGATNDTDRLPIIAGNRIPKAATQARMARLNAQAGQDCSASPSRKSVDEVTA